MSGSTATIKSMVQAVLAGEQEADIKDLETIIKTASDAYYNASSEDISDIDPELLTDSEFEAIERLLRAMDPRNPILSQVGSDVRGAKVPLPFQMGSLDQVYEGDTIRWITSNKWRKEKFTISDKADGTSGLIIYGRAGMLQIAYSRGNGIEGADITRHIKRIPGVPKKMPMPCAIRIEVVMDEAIFQRFAEESKRAGKRVYKTARNYVAGRMNATESPEDFYRNVRCVGTSVVDPEMGKSEQLELMASSGFEIPAYCMVEGHELNDAFLIEYLSKRRQSTTYAIDGVVIDLDDHEKRVNLWRQSSSLNPMYSKKFKVGAEDNVAYPEVVKIHWEPSKDAYLKPRIEIKPVDLQGVTITYCTGFNAKFIRDGMGDYEQNVEEWKQRCIRWFVKNKLLQLPTNTGLDVSLIDSAAIPAGVIARLVEKAKPLFDKFASELPEKPKRMPIGPGAKIQITRSGDVIPTIEKVIVPAATAQLPQESEFGRMAWTDGDVDLYLVDGSNHPIVQQNILIDVFSASRLNIPFLREGSIAKLFEAGYTTPASIIKANLGDLKRIVGESAGEKIYEGMRSRLNPVPLYILAGSSQTLGRGVGTRRIKRLLEDLPDMKDWTVANIVRVEGFESTTAETIYNNLPRFYKFLDEINGFYTLEAPKEKVVGGPFEGIAVCFTGVRSKVLEEKVVAGGGAVVSSINKNTTHLVCKDKNSKSSKMTKAVELQKTGSLVLLDLREAEELWK